MKEFKSNFITAIICLILGLSYSLFKKPEIQIKEVVKVEIKEVEKKVEQKNTITNIEELINKDGSKVIKTQIINNDKIVSTKDTNILSEHITEVNKSYIKKHKIKLFESINKSLDLRTNISYSYKVLNPVFIEFQIDNKLDYKAHIGLELEF